MGSVTVAVTGNRIVANKVIPIRGTSAKLRMGDTNTGINDISRDTTTGRVVRVAAAQRQITLIDTIKPPGRGRLRCIQGDLLICFDEFDIGVVAESFDRLIREATSETNERGVVNIIHLTT